MKAAAPRKDTMDPLIITATPNNCWLYPDHPYPQTVPEYVEVARRSENAGAAILHGHSERWPDWISAIRDETDMIVQCGLSASPLEDRLEIFDNRADMISVITSHHDEAFDGQDFHVLHPREELVEYADHARRSGTRIEFELWHTGSIWNMNWLIERGLVEPPYFTTLFLGWPGGSWTPPTVEEYLARRRHLPEDSVVTVSVMAPQQRDVVAAAITHGDHVRVGTEDYPFDRSGHPADTPTLVAEAAELARALGRPLATPSQAREICGLVSQPV